VARDRASPRPARCCGSAAGAGDWGHDGPARDRAGHAGGDRQRRRWSAWLGGCLGALALLAALWPFAGAAATPTLTLIPARGPCTATDRAILARGAGFPPGSQVYFTIIRERDQAITADRPIFPGRPVGADGTFAERLLLDCGDVAPAGATVRITAPQDPRTGQGAGAGAVFTVAPTLPGLPNTGGGGAVGQRLATAGPLALGALLLALGAIVATRGRARGQAR